MLAVQELVLLTQRVSKLVTTVELNATKSLIAARGKISVDWFVGFKLHLVVNEFGQLLNVNLTPGNVDDRRPVPKLLQGLFGKIFADRGYVSQKLATQLLEEFDIQFFAKPPSQYEQ